MTGSIVNHPLFGRGVVQELRNAAREAVVRFDSGIRTVVQVSMLSVLNQAAAAAAAAAGPQPIARPRDESPPAPEAPAPQWGWGEFGEPHRPWAWGEVG